MSLPDYYGTPLPASDFAARVRLTAQLAMAAQSGAFTAGDHIANSNTGSSVTPMTFAVGRRTPNAAGTKVNGRIVGARCVVTPASSNVVITNFDFDLLLFRPQTSIPYAAGGYPACNAALTLTAAKYKELVAIVPFVNGAWRNPLGALTASTEAYQAAVPSIMSPMPFVLDDLTSPNLVGVLQVKAAWDPSTIANTFDFVLEVEQG